MRDAVADLGEDLIAKVVYTGGAYPPKIALAAGKALVHCGCSSYPDQAEGTANSDAEPEPDPNARPFRSNGYDELPG